MNIQKSIKNIVDKYEKVTPTVIIATCREQCAVPISSLFLSKKSTFFCASMSSTSGLHVLPSATHFTVVVLSVSFEGCCSGKVGVTYQEKSSWELFCRHHKTDQIIIIIII